MKIGVIGSGDVAKVLASGFLKHGHDVVIGTRDPVTRDHRHSVYECACSKVAETASENNCGWTAPQLRGP
jgi:pyrroline-5-carboxylate reductase